MWQFLLEHDGTRAYVLGAGAILLGVLGLVAECGPRARLWRVLPLMALLLVGLVVVRLEASDAALNLGFPLAVLGLACVGCYAVRTTALAGLLKSLFAWLQKPLVAWGMLVAFGLFTILCLQLLPFVDGALESDFGVNLPQLVDDSSLKVVATLQGVTDRGRPVPLYAPQIGPLTQRQLLEHEAPMLEMPTVKNQLIRLGPPDLSYNCHGWVFLGGQYWVRGQHVPTIIEDNGYYLVDTPRVGDVAIFRDHTGSVTHCALVSGFITDDTPLLEGKWGWGSRFLHPPKAQVYALSCDYYRTERPDGHRLRLLIDSLESPLPRVGG